MAAIDAPPSPLVVDDAFPLLSHAAAAGAGKSSVLAAPAPATTGGGRLRRWLARRSPWGRASYAMVCTCVCYIFTYLWKQPIFVLPLDVLNAPVAPGSRVDLQTAFAMSQTVAFFAAKPFAIVFIASPRFYRARVAWLCLFYVLAAACMGGGLALFHGRGLAQALCVGLSAFAASFIYGGLLTFLEGRRQTEAMLAALNFAVVVAGGFSRGVGAFLLEACGVSARYMPLAAVALALPVTTAATVLLGALPPPSAADVRARGARGAMPAAARKAFVWRFAGGIAVLILAYTILMALRGYRDFFARELYTDALGGKTPTAALYFFVDFPGAVIACGALALMTRFRDNVSALLAMLATMVAGVAVLGGATLLEHTGAISELTWWYFCGVGIYVAFCTMGSGTYERLLAAAGATGTITFLQFASDASGYLGTLVLLFYLSFSKTAKGGENAVYVRTFRAFAYAVSVALVGMLIPVAYYFRRKLRGRGAADGNKHDSDDDAEGGGAENADDDGDGESSLARQ